MPSERDSLLKLTLQAAVPLWQMKLQKEPWAEIQASLKGAAELIASRGDVLLFGGGKKGEVADLFNAVARGIAALSFMPGGINAFGEHWEAQHPGLAPKEPEGK